MADEYTPTMQHLRAAWFRGRFYPERMSAESDAEIDRFVAEIRRDQAEKDAGIAALITHHGSPCRAVTDIRRQFTPSPETVDRDA